MFGLRFDDDAIGVPFTHDQALVVLSLIVAFIASYTALELTERLRSARGGAGSVWHSASAIAMGGGIWSTHFIGMLAFETPLERGYDLGLTGLSVVVAIAAAAISLMVVRGRAGGLAIAVAGAILGAGIAAMHYTGMAALVIAGEVFYRASIFAFSIAIALAATTAALWLALTFTSWQLRAAAALVMAIAICGTHYTGVAATILVAGPTLESGATPVSEFLLAGAVALGVFAFVLIGLVGAIYDRRREADAMQEAARLRRLVAERTADLQQAADSLDAALDHAERASAAKSDFLASTSHELRTPLNSILGFTQLLLSGKSFEALSTRHADAVKQIDTSGRHLLQLIDEILDLSRIESGKLDLSLEAVDVGALIEDVAAAFQPSAIEAGITIHTAAPPQGLGAKADHRRLRQVLLNLISNALKYNRRGGEVGVTCRDLDGWAQIAVSDTGGGIPQHLMDDLFEPFNRLGQEQSPVVGSGVGLALCKKLVEAQRGWIRADSREGMGSTFTIGLPMAVLPASAKAAAPDQPRATMLYVEDNPSNVLLMRHIVKEIDGLELLVATNPRDGIELARAVLPSVILLDINLPEIDGFEVLRILRADPETAQIPVFALTANAMPREVERGKAAGFARYLTKPINVQEFLDAVGDMFALAKPRIERTRPASPPRGALAQPAPVKVYPVPRGEVVYAGPVRGRAAQF